MSVCNSVGEFRKQGKTSQRNIDKFQNAWTFFKEKFLIKPVSLNTLPLENFTVKGRDLYK